MSWKKMCLPKTRGDMGCRDALVMKQAQKLARGENLFAYDMLKSKYFPNSDFLESNLGRNPSLIQRSIWEVKKDLSQFQVQQCR